MKKSTREWVRKAEVDRIIAGQCSRSKTPLHDGVCFHCQQCSEKYLKALLEELGLAIPYTHILKDLLALLQPHHPSLASLRRGLTYLTRFGVAIRYPGENTTKRQATSALRWAERVRYACPSLLGLRPRRPRRKKSR
jgi:HEPN domain-containing protein